MRKTLLFLVFILATWRAGAQGSDSTQKCATDQKTIETLEQYPERERMYREMKSDRQNMAAYYLKNTNAIQSVITIPVVFHILYTNETENVSDEQIQSQIEVLNDDYQRLNADSILTPDRFKGVAANSEIAFCLASYDPNGLPTSGIIRVATTVPNIGTTDKYYRDSQGGSNIWDPRSYLNIWVCEISDTLLGFTYLPGLAKPNYDGVVINYVAFGTMGTAVAPYHKGRTTTHEIGHWLGLEHPWGPKIGCEYDDGVADTPLQETFNSRCPSGVKVSCGNAPLGDMYMNYMDYTYDACENIFTQGQKALMRGTLNSNRETLLISRGCTGPDTNFTPSESISFYPNPTNEKVEIVFKFNSEQSPDILVYSVSGMLVMQEKTVIEKGTYPLDVSHLPSGMYIVRVQGTSTSFTEKLIKVNNQ